MMCFGKTTESHITVNDTQCLQKAPSSWLVSREKIRNDVVYFATNGLHTKRFLHESVL